MSRLNEYNNDPKLTVYKASAGSGKTHKLTSEYLSLLFSGTFAYKNILAVTFTNKATDEMKRRIIDELARLATNQKSDYIEELSAEHNLNEKQLRERARNTLERILHDYSAFSVSTIDRFFQQTMRAFTREIGLSGGYNIELDTDSVLTEAIDSMLYDLEHKENAQLLGWLIRFSEEKVENGDNWNIRADIQDLSREIFKESYKAYSTEVRKDIEDKQKINDYKHTLFKIIRNFENESKLIGEKGANIIHRYGLSPSDFKWGAVSPFFYFQKWANGEIIEPTARFINLEDEINNWYTATASSEVKSQIETSFQELNSCISQAKFHYANSQVYQTAVEINRYFFTLGILGDIDEKIRDYTSENNIMLISDTTELLSKIIEGNESPFIYEKVGTRINNYMIDEFQDTSAMQWNNFRPLVKDSLAAANKNIIVGDLKQSIYRWRNSDWKLLDEQLDIDFKTEGVKHEVLDTNWRSDKNIVNFNNAIFTLGASLLQDTYNIAMPENAAENLTPFYDRITRAYGEIYQQMPTSKENSEGYVKLEFIDTKEHVWQDYVLEQIPYQIEELQDEGYRLKDIAILVRTKKEGADVANRLLEYKSQNPSSKYKYDIISDEALYLANSQSVKLIIALLKYMQDSDNLSLRAVAIYEYLRISNQLRAEEALQKYFSEDEQLPNEIFNELKRIKELPLYEMTEEIFELFHDAMNGDEQVYIQSFLDLVLDFTSKRSSDLDAFLVWWEETGIKKTVFTPDGQDAVQIMTIHKSKGLGFDVVILPFCNWAIDHRMPTILWCKPNIAPFDILSLVPVRYSQRLRNTIFGFEYYDERLHAFIDNLNILYVAFTRAKKSLIAFAPKNERKEINDIASLLWQSCNSPNVSTKNGEEYINPSEYFDSEEAIFEYGKLKQDKKEGEKKSNEVEINYFPSVSYDERLKLMLKNKYYFSDTGQRDYGTLMHEVVSEVKTIEDLKPALMDYYIDGSITKEQMEEVYQQLKTYLEIPIVKEWYTGSATVLNEVSILQPNGKFTRPDRVMIKDGEATVIDYKFGLLENDKYLRQVRYYISQIKEMGYKDVKGYLCYISLGKVVEVS